MIFFPLVFVTFDCFLFNGVIAFSFSRFFFASSPSIITMAAAAVTARRPGASGAGAGCSGGASASSGSMLLSSPNEPSSSRATSAVSLIALLSEPEPELVGAALRGLDAAVPQFWFEIAQSIGALEAAAEDEASPHRELASLVASKVRWLEFFFQWRSSRLERKKK